MATRGSDRPGVAGERRTHLGRHGSTHGGNEGQKPGGDRHDPQIPVTLQRNAALCTLEDKEDRREDEKGVAEMKGNRPGAVAVEHGDAAQKALN
jgi:hypothetical protein